MSGAPLASSVGLNSHQPPLEWATAFHRSLLLLRVDNAVEPPFSRKRCAVALRPRAVTRSLGQSLGEPEADNAVAVSYCGPVPLS